MKKIVLLSIILVFCLTTTGCSIESNDMKDISIYTTTYPINYLINSLYGEHAKIYSIYPTGVNLNEYSISDRKIEEYSKSDLFIFNSLDQDRNYAVKMINNNSKLKVIDASTGMSFNYSIEELWLNPYNYLMLAENIKNGLAEYINNPYLVEEINTKYETLEYEISKIDANITESVNNAPYKNIVTDNKLFKFLEKYGLRVIIIDENNISQNTIDEVKKMIANKQIKYIYSVDKEVSNTVNKFITDNKLELITINSMYSVDGEITNSNDNYISIMNNNINLIKKELYK